MKRKKSPKANKAAKEVLISVENTDAEALELSANCSLCLSDESPAYECQQFLFDDLENAFDYSLKVLDKNRFKICVTCSYHISILAKFVNKNICLSGENPLCFMCKNYTVFDIRPSDLKIQLKNTPFGAQTEDKGNYYACVVCLYQLMKYQNYKNLIDNYRNGSGMSTTSATARAKINVGRNQNTTASARVSTVSSTKTKNGPTVLLQKLDLSKFKLTPFVLLNARDVGEQDVSSSKSGRKRGRSDPIYTEVLPKKRRYQPSPSPEPSEHSDVDDTESLLFETWGSGKKSGKRVTINTRPSVMKMPSGTNKTPMKSALKTSPQKTTSNKGKPLGKLQIKFPPKSSKKSPEIKKPGRPPKSATDDKPSKPVTPSKPAGRPSRTPTTPTKSSPRLSVKSETITLSQVEAEADNSVDLDDTIQETPKATRKKRMATKKPTSPMKTPAEKKQMVTLQLSDDDDEAKDGSDAEDLTITDNKPIEDVDSAGEPSIDKTADLTDDQEDDDQAEVIIPEDTDNMDKMAIDDDSEPAQEEHTDNEDADAEKDSHELIEKTVEPNTSANPLDDNDSAAIGDKVSEIVELIKSSIAQEAGSKLDNVVESTTSPTKVTAAATTATNNGNSNSDKENTIDLLRDESNSSDFGVIKKLNNNERVQLDINMDKIFDELRTEATP